MLPSQSKKCWVVVHQFLIIIFLCLVTSAIFAAAETTTIDLPGGAKVSSTSAQDMLVNFSKTIPNLMRLVTAFAYVMGMYLIIAGIIRMKHLGESRTMMSQEHSVKAPLILLATGAMLLYIPTSVQMGLSTFWTDPNPYGYLQEEDQWSQFINVCYLVVQFVGTIAFIRGLLTLSHLGGHGGNQPGTFAKGLTYIIGGILCINIYQFVQVINVTLGLSTY
ncbi:MAG: hypothetical protein H0W64_12260 [Gammaproteobacteria bacterium]|nr:hypothetical protein [Gammaproteobacteria bacterium]